MNIGVQLYLSDVEYPADVIDYGIGRIWKGHQYPEDSHRLGWGIDLNVFDYGRRILPAGLLNRLPKHCQQHLWSNLILEGDWLEKWSDEVDGNVSPWQSLHPQDLILKLLKASASWVFVFAVDEDSIGEAFSATPDECVQAIIANLRIKESSVGFMAFQCR